MDNLLKDHRWAIQALGWLEWGCEKLNKMNASSTTRTYAWDSENRLASVTLPNGGGVVTFTYDPLGRRIQKSSASGTTIYLYDGANVVAEVNTAGGIAASYVGGAPA
jgi:YD repeat-containing protein